MLTRLQMCNLKSWQETGPIQLGKLTGLLGTNSSGKSSNLQMLLLLKQGKELVDRTQVLDTDSERSYVNLGTFRDVIYQKNYQTTLDLKRCM